MQRAAPLRPQRSREWRHVWLHAVLAVAAAVWTAPVSADAEEEEEARAHFVLGRAHFDNGRFVEAAAAFEEAYRISQKPALLYNLYVSYRDAGDTKNAARTLRLYLEKEPVIESRAQLEARLVVLERLAQQDATRQAPPAAAAEPQPAPAAAHEPRAEAPAPAEPEAGDEGAQGVPVVPIVIMGVGGAMVVGSIVTGLMANSAESDIDDMCPTRMNCPPSVKDAQSRGETMALVTDILLFGGIAVAGTGAALWLLGTFDEREPVAAAACTGDGCMAAMHLRF